MAHLTTPKVYLICRPSIDWVATAKYLTDIGGATWQARRPATPNDAESLVEFAGRLCYRSWEPGLNQNVTKVRLDSEEYFRNILQSGHGSVLEHANFSFVFQDVSRVFTHELVRHRAGVAISQESLRYVRLTDIGFRVPSALRDRTAQVHSILTMVENLIEEASRELDEEGVPFSEKKTVTSALRRIAPMGLSTTIMWTANARTLRHVIHMRTARGAEEEIRLVFDHVARVMIEECPMLFQDFRLEGDGEWVPYNVKV